MSRDTQSTRFNCIFIFFQFHLRHYAGGANARGGGRPPKSLSRGDLGHNLIDDRALVALRAGDLIIRSLWGRACYRRCAGAPEEPDHGRGDE